MHTIGRHTTHFIASVNPTALRHLILTLNYLIEHDREQASFLTACQGKLCEVLGEAVAAGGFPQMSDVRFDDVRFAYEVAQELLLGCCSWFRDETGGPGYNFWQNTEARITARRTHLLKGSQ